MRRFLAVAMMMAAGCAETPSGNSPSAAHGPAIVANPASVPANGSVPGAEQAVSLKRGSAFSYHPTVMPDRVVLTWCGDPARSQAVTWRTDAAVEMGLAELAVADDDGQFARRARQIKATSTKLTIRSAIVRCHSARFEALSPGTKYAYRVGDGRNWTEWFHFITAEDTARPFSFLYFGDAQEERKSLWPRVIREACREAPKARFLLHAGDLVNSATSDEEWGDWFQGAGWLNAMTPNVPTPGNHEYAFSPNSAVPVLTEHWRNQFTLPENGPPGLEESTYFLDYQGVRIVSLNSNEKLVEQASWLDRILESNPCRWTIVAFHHPIYSAARSRDNALLRKLWQPVFDKHRVDLALQGHDHSYARTGLVRGSGGVGDEKNLPSGVTARDASSGTVYVVSVSGPKMYDMDRPVRSEFRRVAEDVQLFQIITVDGDELHFVAKTATGTDYDGFTLRKRAGMPNELIEQAPSLPPRLRASHPPINSAPPRPPAGTAPAVK